MAVLLLFAGQEGPRVKLAYCLREIHAEAKAARDAEMARRRTHCIPLDDHVDWAKVTDAEIKLGNAIERDDSAAARAAAETVLEQTARGLQALPDLVLPEGAEDIEVKFRVLSDADARMHSGNEAAAWSALQEARKTKDEKAASAAVSDVVKARSAMVQAGVVELHGIEGVAGVDEKVCDALARAGLLTPIYEAASFFQGLPAKKAVRFGLPRESISPSSTVAPAQESAAQSWDVTAGHGITEARVRTSPVPSSSQTHVHGVNS